jgi:hypothetical protein
MIEGDSLRGKNREIHVAAPRKIGLKHEDILDADQC